MSISFRTHVFTATLIALSAGPVLSENFPIRPIRVITNDAGGGTDFAARVVAQGLSATIGQQVIVDNRGGAGGAISFEIAARTPADGYTMLVASSNFWTLPLLGTPVKYDPVNDFSPITLISKGPNIVVVNPALPANSIKELIVTAAAKPGALNYATSGTGSQNHLAAELFKTMANVNLVHVPYKGAGPAMTNVIGGEAQVMFASASAAAPHIKSNRVRALAVTSSKASALAPGLPTVAASGLPGYEAVSIYGVLAPLHTPAGLVSRLNEAIVRVINQADVKDRLFSAGTDAIGSTPQEYAAAIKSELKMWGDVIKRAGISVE